MRIGAERPGYSPCVAYVDQFERLVRAVDRGRAIKNTRTIAVFDDGLVVCAVRVHGGAARPGPGWLGGLRRSGRGAGATGRGEEQLRSSAQIIGSAVEFAPTWPKAQLIPLAVVEKIVLTRPRQVSELVIVEQTGNQAAPATSTYLGDLSASQVRAALAPLLGDRLEILVSS